MGTPTSRAGSVRRRSGTGADAGRVGPGRPPGQGFRASAAGVLARGASPVTRRDEFAPACGPTSVEGVGSVLTRNCVTLSGAPTGRPMVFAHGYGCDQAMWRFVAPDFEVDHRVVLFDHVGAGRSDLSAYDRQKYGSLRGYAEDVVEICRELRAWRTCPAPLRDFYTYWTRKEAVLKATGWGLRVAPNRLAVSA